jgi:hypothetical protein
VKQTLNRTGWLASRSLQKIVRKVGAWGWTRPSRTDWEGTRWLIVELDREEETEDWIPSHPFIIARIFNISCDRFVVFVCSWINANKNLRRKSFFDWCSFQRWSWKTTIFNFNFNPLICVLPILPLSFNCRFFFLFSNKRVRVISKNAKFPPSLCDAWQDIPSLACVSM